MSYGNILAKFCHFGEMEFLNPQVESRNMQQGTISSNLLSLKFKVNESLGGQRNL